MNIFIYGDESGVFDRNNHDYFVFGGLIFLSKEDKDAAARKFLHAERSISPQYDLSKSCGELKSCGLKRKHRSSLFRSTNKEYRYGCVVNIQSLNDNIFDNKKSKQRYLDYAYKIGLKRSLGRLIACSLINPTEVEYVYIYFDNHTTATNGHYELREGIETEFKHGTINYRYNMFHEPLFKGIKGVNLEYKDSKTTTLIRASDNIANMVNYHARNNTLEKVPGKLMLCNLP